MKKDIAFGGVTRIPGGALSSDGDLMAAVDVCNDGMGLEMLEKPKLLFELKNETVEGLKYTENLLCIHEPEGEEKHYITQLMVESIADTQSAPALRSGEQEVVLESSEPVDPYNPYVVPVDPEEPPTIDDNSDMGVVPYVEPPESVEFPLSDYVTVETAEEDVNGDTVVTPPSGGSLSTPTTQGIYLLWRKDNGDGSSTIMQEIEITAFGKVTAIQPMGNTLICNHEGVAGTSLAQIRYYLFKKESSLYVPLGNKPPYVEIRFGLVSEFKYYPTTESTFKGNGEYNSYNGVQTQVTGYLDTIPIHKGEGESEGYNWILPVGLETAQGWRPTYSIEGVSSPDGKTDVAGIKNQWTTSILGCYNKFIAEQTKENRFVFPFYLRYAYELYDGSLIMHSYPILMIPNSRGPIFALDGFRGIRPAGYNLGESYESVRITTQGRTYGFASTLMHQISALSAAEQARLANWKDLIRGINIYVTPPIYNYNQGGQVLGWHSMSDADPANGISSEESTAHSGHAVWDKYYTIGKVRYGSNQVTQGGEIGMRYAFESMLNANAIFKPYTDSSTSPATVYRSPDYCMTVPQKDIKDWLELHENAGQFYKLAEIDYETLLTYTEHGMADGAVPIPKRKLSTISNQDVMTDDNGSHDTMSAEVLYEYNRRINMARVSRQLHSPVALPTQWAHDYTTGHSYHEIVHVNNGGLVAELRTTTASMGVNWPQFIFYPNTDAKEAIFIKDSVRYIVKLKEHKALNGMYWLADYMEKANSFSECQMNTTAAASVTLSTTETNKIVDESNKIYTSETDNPFYVPFGNINIAGGGEVRALCSATQAMSQGQFGQHPMYCFTSEGVWAMTVGDTGGWATIQPVTRDVISEHTMPLSLDSTVVFLTERGLLQLAGAQIKVLSDVLQGADPLLFDTPNFGLHRLDDLCGENATGTGALLEVATALAEGKFPEKAWLAYDYDNARIYVTPQDGGGSWVYNLKSELWTQASTALDRQIVSYPECEQQCGGKVVRISVDRAILSNLCEKGIVISRPIKLADMGLLKRWREIAVRGRFKPYSTAVQVALWGTRDWVDSALVASSTRNRLTRWSGSPYFGHSVGLFLTRPDYAMQVAGMDVEVDAEHDNKLR